VKGGELKVLRIPDEEKTKGMLWVIYPVIYDRFSLEIMGFAELQIKHGQN